MAAQSTFTACLDIHLRHCRQEDLLALEWMGLYTRDRAIIHDTFRQQRAGSALMLLAVANDVPLAQAWLDFNGRGSKQCPSLWAVRVFPPLQGCGIGAWIIASAEDAARARGASDIKLEVEPENTLALRLYARLGYRPVGWKPKRGFGVANERRAPAVDLQIMQKVLRTC
jgi:GNAT superfamily N-acetyltransferase